MVAGATPTAAANQVLTKVVGETLLAPTHLGDSRAEAVGALADTRVVGVVAKLDVTAGNHESRSRVLAAGAVARVYA